MKKPILYFLAGMLTVIGIIGVLWSFGMVAETMWGGASSASDFDVLNTVPSPSGDYVATLYVGMGGGAAGWCNKRVNINRKDEPFDLEKAKREADFVFSASCSSKVDVIWKTNTELHIAYSSDEYGVSTYQRPMSRDKVVKIVYLPK